MGKGYGLYYFDSPEPKILRYDDTIDEDFIKTNDIIWNFGEIDETRMSESESVYDYMSKNGLNQSMIDMVSAGYSNTQCCNSKELSMKQCIKWCRTWDEESPTVS